MSPEAQALARVEATKAWHEMADATTLGSDPKQSRYLKHRLQAAFLLGVQNGVEIAAERVRNAALGKTD